MAVTIIGGNEVNYIQEDAPSNPQVGETWRQFSSGRDWRWNGTYWVSKQLFEISHAAHSSNDINGGSLALNGSYALQGAFNTAFDIYVEEISYNVYATGKSSSNYFTITSSYADGISGIPLTTTTTKDICPTHADVGHLTKQIGIALSVPNNSNTHSFFTSYTKTGSISNLNINLFYRYRLIYK